LNYKISNLSKLCYFLFLDDNQQQIVEHKDKSENSKNEPNIQEQTDVYADLEEVKVQVADYNLAADASIFSNKINMRGNLLLLLLFLSF
jgi:hypothetical protein